MIFVMIAGSYTPVCLIVLHGRTGYILCTLVWTVAIIGMILKGCWINCPKWLSSVIYIGMGWLCVLALFRSSTICPVQASDGSLPAASSIPSAV